MNPIQAQPPAGPASDNPVPPEPILAAHLQQAEDSRRAALNLMEDAVQARRAVEDLNATLRASEDRLANELAGTQRLQKLSGRLVFQHDPGRLYEEILDAAMDIMRSDYASMQMLHPERGSRGELRLLGFRGFNPEAAKFWEWVRADSESTCGEALRTGKRAIATDVEKCDFMAGTKDLATSLQTGIHAVQSTPLVARDGKMLGMISTHWRQPHDPPEQTLRLLDILARLAADAIERKSTEQALRASEERYRTFTDQVRDYAIFRTDVAGRALTWNQGVRRILGFEEADFLGKDIVESIFTPEDVRSGAAQRELDTAAETGSASNDRWMMRRNGERFYANGVTTSLRDDSGQLIGFTKVMRDVTAQHEMEHRIRQQAGQLADESRRKDEFLAMLSHELRNPLAPIRSAVHLLRMQERGSENRIQEQAREIIERQVGNLTKLVSDLLEVSRVVSGRVRLDQQTVDLNQVVRHAAETVGPLIKQRNHELVLQLDDEPIWINADATRIEEVLTNLLNNAAKYTDEGGRIEVRGEPAPGGDHAQVRVRDNGVGIDKELLPRIFDLFTQAERSLARSAGGLGIGLSLAQRLVLMHGGTIEVHSPPQDPPGDRGSEFIVKLPLAHPPERPQLVEHGAATALQPAGMRVLVVDDNIDQATMLSSTLKHVGYSVQSAYTGPDGLKVALQWRPDVVLLDIGLPGLDGYEVARRLRSDPTTKTVRLIALTGYARDTDVALAREAGFDAHLSKPLEFGELEKLMPPLPA